MVNVLQKTSFFAAIVALLVIGVVSMFHVKSPGIAVGSTIVGNDYNSTTTLSTSAGTHWLARTTATAPGCALGSVIIASTTATANITLWNATSTTDVSSTTIVTFPANAAAGTYTIDSVCTRGLVVETPTGFTGQTIVTWR